MKSGQLKAVLQWAV